MRSPDSQLEAYPNQLPESCWNIFRLKTIQLVAVRNNSLIYRCNSAKGELAVKCCLDPATGRADQQAAQCEFMSLEQLAETTEAAGEARLAPIPVGLLSEHGIIAMTWEPGQPMTQLLLSPFNQSQIACDCGTAAGDWLRRFHQLHPLVERSSDFQGKMSFIENELAGHGLSHDRLLEHAMGLLRKRAAAAEAVRLPFSWAYGDFKSDNLLVHGTQVLALDVQLQHENSVIHNIVPFLAHLELLRWSPRGFLNWRGLTQAGACFLAAYSPMAHNWRLPIAWLQAAMLSLRAIDNAGAASIGGRVRKAMVRRALAGSVRRLERV